jgi:hypothetical protein
VAPILRRCGFEVESCGSPPAIRTAVHGCAFFGLFGAGPVAFPLGQLASVCTRTVRIHTGPQVLLWNMERKSCKSVFLGSHKFNFELMTIDIRRAHAQWIHACPPGRSNEKVQAFGNRRMCIRKSAGEESRALGRGAHGSEDGGMPVAQAAARWVV